ncbi:MAG: VWA domain-containing protein, partial [Phycisphaerae bacterium]|nr:VWA domain-containing protein [Phycisphaerae bacterium]
DGGPTEAGADDGGIKLAAALNHSDIDARYSPVSDFPDNLTQMMDTDGIILVNTGSDNFTYQQQEVIARYVTDLGGGLIMVGGDSSFGAGGWIGSPVAEILPVDMDPPQKKQLPKGALVLIMHACEIPQGNYWGKQTAKSAVNTLSRLDMAGILAYGWQGSGNWVHKLQVVGDKETINAKIDMMTMGDMPDLGALLQQAYDALKDADAAQKHVLVISDGDPQRPTPKLLAQCKAAGITCSGIAINPHSQNDIYSLRDVAEATGGRFYFVKNANELPRIFIKEAQTVRRALILEETFTPNLTYSLSEITSGVSFPLPPLDGYVLTGPRQGLSQIILSSHQGDPILASCQSGLGRAVAFTSSANSQWAANWLGWSGFETFWEQTVRWAAKSTQNSDCDVFVDVQGRDVSVNVEAVDGKGNYMQFASIDAQVIAPDVSSKVMGLSQTGPGQYQGSYQATASGSYIVNLRYRKIGDDKTYTRQVPVTVPFAPEFRDLSDNGELLREIAEDITGGRNLSISENPKQANIFDATGLKYPQAQLPLTKPLMLVWLGVFLLDIAVRRISIDFKAMFRKTFAFMYRPKAPTKASENLQRLRMTRKSASEKLAQRSQRQKAAKRYDGSGKAASDIPVAGENVTAEPKPRKAEKETKKTKEKPAAPQSHIDQLLKAKRKANDNQDT